MSYFIEHGLTFGRKEFHCLDCVTKRPPRKENIRLRAMATALESKARTNPEVAAEALAKAAMPPCGRGARQVGNHEGFCPSGGACRYLLTAKAVKLLKRHDAG